MQAIIRTKAGKDLSTMEVQSLESPAVSGTSLKVKMATSRINPVDIDLMKGMPFIKYKKPQIGGVDGAGTVVAVGSEVANFKPGDQVFFYRKFTDIGTWAEEVIIDQSDVALIPDNISVEDAGAIALPLLTAYDSLLQLGVQKGERILIHGAGGGVGFQAVQLAKQLGLYVIANASQRDFEALKAVGVDELIDYKTNPFYTVIEQRSMDYVFDVIGKDTLMRSLELAPKKVVSVAYIDPSKMAKTGIQMPGILKWMLRLSMRKFTNTAKRNNVTIIGQVTGADGALLKQAAERVEAMNYSVRPYRSIRLEEIKEKGLNGNDLGKIILF